jgi:hypothetical protein
VDYGPDGIPSKVADTVAYLLSDAGSAVGKFCSPDTDDSSSAERDVVHLTTLQLG